MGMKIAEGSTYEVEITEIKKYGQVLLIDKDGEIVRIHVNDIPELIKELERISRGE